MMNLNNSSLPLFGNCDSEQNSMTIDLTHCQSNIAFGWDDFPSIVEGTTISESSDSDSCTNTCSHHSPIQRQLDYSYFACLPEEYSSSHIATTYNSTTFSLDKDEHQTMDIDFSFLIQQHQCNINVESQQVRLIDDDNTWSASIITPSSGETDSDDDSDILSDISLAIQSEVDEMEVDMLTAEPKSKSSHSRHVKFTTVQIREYAVTLGDHPLADAYPLSLDWSYAAGQEITYDLEQFCQKQMKELRRYQRECQKHHWTYSRTFGRPCRLDVMERRSRLASIMGISHDKLDMMERQRKSVGYI